MGCEGGELGELGQLPGCGHALLEVEQEMVSRSWGGCSTIDSPLLVKSSELEGADWENCAVLVRLDIRIEGDR